MWPTGAPVFDCSIAFVSYKRANPSPTRVANYSRHHWVRSRIGHYRTSMNNADFLFKLNKIFFNSPFQNTLEANWARVGALDMVARTLWQRDNPRPDNRRTRTRPGRQLATPDHLRILTRIAHRHTSRWCRLHSLERDNHLVPAPPQLARCKCAYYPAWVRSLNIKKT